MYVHPSATAIDNTHQFISDQNVLTDLQNFALNKKSGWERESGAVAFQSLAAVLGPPSAPALLPSLPVIFDLLSDKGEVVRTAALAATKAILQLLPPEATRTVFWILEDILEKGKWQTKVGALDALKGFVARAKDSVADELGHILPKVEAAMHDTKKEVRIECSGTTSLRRLDSSRSLLLPSSALLLCAQRLRTPTLPLTSQPLSSVCLTPMQCLPASRRYRQQRLSPKLRLRRWLCSSRYFSVL